MPTATKPRRIWFTQQAPYDYAPLRAGLGQITPAEFDLWQVINAYIDEKHPFARRLCPKVYTTRTRPLQGEYVVVEGSRYKAKPVTPEIRFRAHPELDFTWNEHITPDHFQAILGRGGLIYPELDLGIKGTDYRRLADALLDAYPRATNDTRWYVNRLEPLGCAG